MKICTITCHDVYNHGASLQAFALMNYLNKCGHDVEIINYKPDYLSNHYNLLSINNPKWENNLITKSVYLFLKIPGRLPGLKRKKAFDKFTSKYLKVTKIKYKSNEELKGNIPVADAFICGSDQIWNSLHKNGKDPAFYLDFVPSEKIKASYAASFATDYILDDYIPLVSEKVTRLEGVSVREKSGVEILKKLNINEAVNVVDPVFLLEKEDWNKLGNKVFKEEYILVYDFDNSDLVKEIALELRNKKGWKIYTINPLKQGYADKYLIYDGPEVFVSLVKNAKFIISNSYHATVFSIIYEKDFVIVNRNEAINTRMRDLLDDLMLNERLIIDKFTIDQILRKVDFNDINRILNEKIKISKKYLNDVLAKKK